MIDICPAHPFTFMSEQMMFLPSSLIQAVAPDRGTQPRDLTICPVIFYD
jgi:hypothetical protein